MTGSIDSRDVPQRDRPRSRTLTCPQIRTHARAQAFTLEAIVAAVVVLGGLLFALQVAGVTSLTDSTSNRAVVEQQEAVAAGVLDAAVANDSVRSTLLYWDPDERSFHRTGDVDDPFYTTGPPTAFGALLNETLGDRNLAYNVDLLYLDSNETVRRTPLVSNGEPSDDAARATRTLTLYDDERLLDENLTATNRTLGNVSASPNASFYAPDRFPDDPTYAVIRVEVVVWRI